MSTAEELLRVLGRTRLSVNFVELATSMLALSKADWFGYSATWPVPARGRLVIEERAPPGEVVVSAIVKISVDVDGVLEYRLYVDDKLRYVDTAVRSASYPNYINFLQAGALFAGTVCRREVVNNSDQVVHLTEFSAYVRVPKVVWDKVISKYFEVVAREVGL